MGIEINHARRLSDGRVRFEVELDSLTLYTRVTLAILEVEAAAFAPREPTAPPYSHAEALQQARQTTLERLPRASVGPFDTTLGGQPLPEHVAALIDSIVEEPQGLKNGEAYGSEEHERRAGGTSSDEAD